MRGAIGQRSEQNTTRRVGVDCTQAGQWRAARWRGAYRVPVRERPAWARSATARRAQLADRFDRRAVGWISAVRQLARAGTCPFSAARTPRQLHRYGVAPDENRGGASAPAPAPLRAGPGRGQCRRGWPSEATASVRGASGMLVATCRGFHASHVGSRRWSRSSCAGQPQPCAGSPQWCGMARSARARIAAASRAGGAVSHRQRR